MTTTPPSRALHISLWVVQVLLAVAFAMAGLVKATQPIAELAKQMPFATDLPMLTRIAGVSEVVGALGLVLPAATRVRPTLTPLAGASLALVMLLAAGLHVMRGELESLPVNFALGGLAAFVAWGRSRKAPIAPR